ncbi:DNA cytosine methyltransferase [Rhizobium leguminosarum]
MENPQDDGVPTTNALEDDLSGPLLAAGERIQKYKRKQIEYFLKVAMDIATLTSDLPIPSAKLTSWLRTEFGFSADEVEVFANFPPDAAANAKLLEDADISPDTLRAIIGSDRRTRSECFIRIARGDQVDEELVEKIRRSMTAAAMSAEEIEQQRRLEAFSRASSAVGATAIHKLEREASELLNLMDEAVAELEGGAAPEDALDSRRTAFRERAAPLLQSVESLFGSNHPARDREIEILRQGTAAASITYSWYALRNLHQGRIEIRDLAASNDDWKGVRACVEFLAGRRSSAVSHATSMGTPPRLEVPAEPTFIDIDAGVGGTSLGLQAAGFRAAAVYVKDTDARRTLRENRPSWDVRKFVERDFHAELCALAEKNVDLLTCGLPWHHYHPRNDAGAATRNALTAVEVLRPKAFIFEAESEEYDEGASRPFKDLGYDVRWHEVDISRFGIAQLKSRSVMIGARDGYLDSLSMPVIDPPRRETLPEVIGDLVAGHLWDGTEDETTRLRHETEVSKWARVCSRKFPLAPEMPSPHRRRRKKDWLKRRIDIGGYTNRPPTLENFESEEGFRLTTAMLKRIQSFPDTWLVETDKSNAPQVASSFPPVAAKMLGLAIHAALTGTEFDYRRAVRTSLLGVKRIRVRRGEPLEWMSTPVSRLLFDPNRAFLESVAAQRRAQWVKDRFVYSSQQSRDIEERPMRLSDVDLSSPRD